MTPLVLLLVAGLALTTQQALGWGVRVYSWGSPGRLAVATVGVRILRGLVLCGAAWGLVVWGAPGVGPPVPGSASLLAGGVALLALPVAYRSARRSAIWAQYPEVRLPVLGPVGVVGSALAWMVYLFGYEALFRGPLTFGLVDAWGVVPGLLAMTAVYVLAHLYKPRQELLGTLPMGMVFGWMALTSGSFLGCWLLHCALAVGVETIAARSDPARRWWPFA